MYAHRCFEISINVYSLTAGNFAEELNISSKSTFKIFGRIFFSSGIYEPATRTVTFYSGDLRSYPAWGMIIITEF
jgi:hypothetical protein